MGVVIHEAVIVTTYPQAPNLPDVEAFRQSMPEDYRHLLVGPIPSVANGGITYFFAPDGSKEGWAASDKVDEWRQRFVKLFSFHYEDGSSPFYVVAVEYGPRHRRGRLDVSAAGLGRT